MKSRHAKKVELPVAPTKEEIQAANLKVLKKIKVNEDNRDYTALTLHNSMHSFETYFFQYSDWLNISPEVILDGSHLKFRWGKVMEIQCNGANFILSHYKDYPSFAAAPVWERREALMKRIMLIAKDYQFPIEPC